jgi:hypothetical protein
LQFDETRVASNIISASDKNQRVETIEESFTDNSGVNLSQPTAYLHLQILNLKSNFSQRSIYQQKSKNYSQF